ncbi:MAG: tetratricopeptide repeat protein [Myxococcota bacterium]
MSAPSAPRRLTSLLPALLLVGCAAALYARSLDAPFVFDDVPSIVENKNIRALWPLSQALTSRPQSSTAGRPLASLSFALSYAAFGLDPRGWRAVNVALHAACALLLLGVARRTLGRVSPPPDLGPPAGGLALAISLLWAVHPLATEAVAYVTQRTELLMALAFLASVYAAARGFERERAGDSPRAWLGLAVGAVWLGVGAKEVMVAAPPLLLLYDRAFESGSFATAWRRHRALHIGAFASWLALAALLAGGPRDATVGFGLPISPATYALTQLNVIAWYLRLAVWPAPLVIAHDWPLASGLAHAWAGICVVVPLAAATVWACVRRPQLGFLGAWLFGILAPTSSVVPIVSELAAERRMYLPLAALVAGAVLGAHALLRSRAPRGALAALVTCAALALAGASALRLEVYRSTIALWSQVLDVYPAHRLRGGIESAIAQELWRENRLVEALPHFERAAQLQPSAPEDWANLGRARFMQGEFEAAVTAYGRAVALAPDDGAQHGNLGLALARLSRWSEAEPELEKALAADPANKTARTVLARVLVHLGEASVMKGDLAAAVPRFQRAVQLDRGFSAAQQDLVETLMRLHKEHPETHEGGSPTSS